MNILLLLIPISLLLLFTAVAAFAWAVRKGQFDDLDTPAIDILCDTPPTPPASSASPPATIPQATGAAATAPEQPTPPCRSTG